MKIAPSYLSQSASGGHSSLRSEDIATAARSLAYPTRQGHATVQLSPAARQLAHLQGRHAGIDPARLQALRDAIASGQLKIDTGRIADGLLATARALLG